MVKKSMLHPLEVEIYYVLPTVRKHLALNMKEKGLKQKDIARWLGINTATISQYSSKKRGNRIKFNEKVLEEIKKSASKIRDQYTYIKEVQHLLQHIRETGTICEVHRQFSSLLLKCDPKKTGCCQRK